jgi:uncharacterized membrane protein
VLHELTPLGVAFDACLAVVAASVALWLRPWRGRGASGPPWPWLVAWAVLPVLWGVDRYAAAPLVQPMSGAVALVLLAGWPLSVLGFLPVALITVLAGHVGWLEGLHRLVWLGVVPATLALALGAALRRWLPHHLFVYILGRGFLGTLVVCALAGAADLLLFGASSGVAAHDLFLAHLLGAFGEAFLTGMMVAVLVAFRPLWLATYTDRLYLPTRPEDRPGK